LYKITVILLLSEGNYSFAIVTERVKCNIARKLLAFTVTSLQILGLHNWMRYSNAQSVEQRQCLLDKLPGGLTNLLLSFSA